MTTPSQSAGNPGPIIPQGQEKQEKHNLADGPFLVYLAAFLGIWTAYVFWAFPHVQVLGETTLAYAAASIGVRVLVWVLPVFLMLRFVDGVEPLRSLGLSDHYKRGLLIGLGLSALWLAIAFLRFGWPRELESHVTWNSILGTSLGVGFFEEIPFRGYILQKLGARMNFWLANSLTSLIFVSLHLPGWFLLHLLTPALALNVFVIGFVLGVVFRYSQSLWSGIVVHDVNNFVSAVLFPGR